MSKLETLGQSLQAQFGERLKSLKLALGEATIEVDAADYLQVMQELRDSEALCFDELIDLCGVDYLGFGSDEWDTDVSSEGFSRGVEGRGVGRFKYGETTTREADAVEDQAIASIPSVVMPPSRNCCRCRAIVACA